jgi:hypothetical protein
VLMSLHDALRRNASPKEIKAFVARRPDSVYERERGAFPIHTAVRVGAAVQVLECLLQNPKAALLLDRIGNTVLHFVGSMSFHPAVEFLVGLWPQLLLVRNLNGELPLHSAAEDNASEDTLRFLALQYPQALAEHDYTGYLPIHRLFDRNASMGRIRWFVEMDRHFDIRQVHPQGGGLTLHYAVMHKCPLAVISHFFAMYPDSIQARDESGRCPLFHHFSVFDIDEMDFGWDEVLTFLLNEWGNADPPIDNNGNTLLHHAAEGWSTAAAVGMLLERWPDAASATNNQGLTPSQCARAQEDPSLGALALLRREAPPESRTSPSQISAGRGFPPK